MKSNCENEKFWTYGNVNSEFDVEFHLDGADSENMTKKIVCKLFKIKRT